MRRLIVLVLMLAMPACTPLQPKAPQPAPVPASTPHLTSLVRIHKAARTLEVWVGMRPVLRLTGIQLGRQPLGPKQFEGDGRTPEGRYLIDWRNTHSGYHLSLHVSYPDRRQAASASAQGRSAGGMIMIHGQPNGYQGRAAGDWTDGCIAVSDAQIEALWEIVPDGSIVDILP